MPEGICEVLSMSTDAPDDSCTETKVLPDRSSNSIRTGPCIGLVLLKLMCELNTGKAAGEEEGYVSSSDVVFILPFVLPLYE